MKYQDFGVAWVLWRLDKIMVALMYDGLELGRFVKTDEKLVLKLNDNIERSWLPYIFDIGLDCDMEKIVHSWIKERIFPKNRIGAKQLLENLGLKKYDREKIAEITRCSVITDPYWIAYKETDTYYNNSIRGRIGGKSYPYNSIGIRNEDEYIWRK